MNYYFSRNTDKFLSY